MAKALVAGTKCTRPKRLHIGNPKKDFALGHRSGRGRRREILARADQPGIDEFYAPAATARSFSDSRIRQASAIPAGGKHHCAFRHCLRNRSCKKRQFQRLLKIDPLLALQRMQSLDGVMSSLESPRPVQHRSDLRVCVRRAFACDYRNLCGRRVFRVDAHAGDCHPDGAGCANAPEIRPAGTRFRPPGSPFLDVSSVWSAR